MNSIVIIGANEFQNKLILKAKKLGLQTHVFAWKSGAVGEKNADYFYPISIVEKEKILEECKRINPIGVCSIGSDLAVPTVNYVANKLKLPSNSNECSKITTNKYLMRKILKKNNLPIPKFKLIKNKNDFMFSDDEFPLIMKPIDRSGSRGVFLINNKDDFENLYEKTKSVSFQKNILVEQFIEGKEYSVEFISQNGKHQYLQITEKITTNAPNFIEKFHFQPAEIQENLKLKVIKILKNALTALKIKNGASHSEIKIFKDNVYIIEIASRMGGDFIGSDLVEYSTGYDYLKNTINVSIGKKIENFEINKNHYSLSGFIISKKDKEIFDYILLNFKNNLKEYNIKSDLNNVSDSSNRNGYYIMSFEKKDQFDNFIMNLKEMGYNL